MKRNSSEINMENEPDGGSVPGNWAEERVTVLLGNTGARSQSHKKGCNGTVLAESTQTAAFTQPKDSRIKKKGLRTELLEKHLIKSISDQINVELNPKSPAPELCSVTRTDYTAEGFRYIRPAPSMDHDYKSDGAITFWSENIQSIQGMTAVKTRDNPFKKNATFSTPITECLEDTTRFTPES